MGQWLVGEFTPFGVHSHLQNWMPIAAAIVVIAVLNAWLKTRR